MVSKYDKIKFDEDDHRVSTTTIGASIKGELSETMVDPSLKLGFQGREAVKSQAVDLFDDLDLSRPSTQTSQYSEFEVDMKLGGGVLNVSHDGMSEPRNGQGVHVINHSRRVLLSWRLKPCYVVYCLFCLVASAVLFLYTLSQGHAADWKEDLYKTFTWVEAIELFLGVSIVIETSITYRVVGWRAFFRDKWCLFDLVISALTVISWFFILCTAQNWATHIEGDLEMPLIAIRFGLQPLRVISTFMALYKTRRMQRNATDVHFEMVSLADDLQLDADTAFRDVAVQISSYLPVSLRFNQWYLAYSPKIHGLSIHTMYRRLQSAGECLVIVRDHRHCVFGGFAPGIQRQQRRSFVTNSEGLPMDNTPYFVFDKRLNIHFYQEDPMPPIYCDDRMISFGRALTIDSDFLHGSSQPCNAYGTIEYLGSNDEFIIQDLEIWCFQPIVDEAMILAEIKKEKEDQLERCTNASAARLSPMSNTSAARQQTHTTNANGRQPEEQGLGGGVSSV